MKKNDNKEEMSDTNNRKTYGSRKNSWFLIYVSSYNYFSYINYTEEKF